jgi:hypothetical protein
MGKIIEIDNNSHEIPALLHTVRLTGVWKWSNLKIWSKRSYQEDYMNFCGEPGDGITCLRMLSTCFQHYRGAVGEKTFLGDGRGCARGILLKDGVCIALVLGVADLGGG